MGRNKAAYDWHGTGRLGFFDGSTHESLLPVFPVVFYTDFLGIANDGTNDLAEDTDSGTSAAMDIVAGVNGIYEFDSGTVPDKHLALSTELVFQAALGCGMEFRLKSTTSDAGLLLVAGFTDAKAEAAGTVAFTDGSLAAGTVDSVAEDAVMFGVRAETSDNIYALSVKNNGTPQSTDSGIDLVLDAWHTYRIQLDSLGNARFYIDGVQVAEHLLAVTTTDPLCASVQLIITTGSTAAFVDLDYIRVWQNRS